MKKYKINYNEWNEDASPIKDDVKINVSHNKLVAQSQNANERAKWAEKNPDKQRKIASSGGQNSKTKEGRKRMSEVGKKYGPNNAVEFIPIETKRKNGRKARQNLIGDIVCEKCGRKTNIGNYAQFHGKKCREKDKVKILKKLPDKFTKSMLKEVAEKMEIMDWSRLNLLHPTCPYTKCIIKVDNPNQYNPCWYGKNKREINKI